MIPRKTPCRLGYKREITYPTKVGVLQPSHGNGPRCKVVDYDWDDGGPWITLQIMRIDDDDVEEYKCAMPRYYAIPLILINKYLAFVEARCYPDGTPLPRSSSCGVKQRDLREYTYLWRLRSRFLQAVFDMNHERLLNERWRYDGIHGFLHRMYGRFGHDKCQRIAYWREEIKEGRVPYTAPNIAEMDWKAYIHEDLTTSTRINAFLWNRVSQGYSRVVKDKPAFESWRAWRAGHRDYEPVLYLTPASSPVREVPSELDGVLAAAVAERARSGSSSDCGAGGYDTTGVRTMTAPPIQVAAVLAAAASTGSSGLTSYSESATGSRRGVGVAAAGGTGNGNEDRDDEAEQLEYTSFKKVAVLTTTLTVPPDSQVWGLPSPSYSSGPSQSSSSSSGGSRSRSTNTSTSDQKRNRREMQIRLNLDAPEDLDLAVVECTFRRREDVKNFKTELRAIYA